MKIAVLSDIHDNIWSLKRALDKVRGEGCKTIVFCGDFCAPFSATMLAESKLPVYAVLGDSYDTYTTLKLTADHKNFHLFSEMGEVELDKKKIAICHYPKLAKGLALTGEYDAVFYGHDHKAFNDFIDKTLLANPGEVMGRFGKCTFGIYETTSGKFRIIEI